jgi:ribose 5-phosphate isomerase A
MSRNGEVELLKKQAALEAVALVEDGMIVGLGTGSTASYAIEALAQRVKGGLKIQGIPTSRRTAEQAERLGIVLTDFSMHRLIDLTIDGADEVEVRSLNVIKGLGGALLREKIVAAASKKLIIVVDERKMVDRLASHTPVPVEVIPFGWQVTAERLANFDCQPKLRLNEKGEPFISDGGHYILDCAFKPIDRPAELAQQLDTIIGVVEIGLFIGLAKLVITAKETGVEFLSCK